MDAQLSASTIRKGCIRDIVIYNAKIDISKISTPPKYMTLMQFYTHLINDYVIDNPHDSRCNWPTHEDDENGLFQECVEFMIMNHAVDVDELLDYLYTVRFFFIDVEQIYMIFELSDTITYAQVFKLFRYINHLFPQDANKYPYQRSALLKKGIVNESTGNNLLRIRIHVISDGVFSERFDVSEYTHHGIAKIESMVCNSDIDIKDIESEFDRLYQSINDNAENAPPIELVNKRLHAAYILNRVSWRYGYDRIMSKSEMYSCIILLNTTLPEHAIQVLKDDWKYDENNIMSWYCKCNSNPSLVSTEDIRKQFATICNIRKNNGNGNLPYHSHESSNSSDISDLSYKTVNRSDIQESELYLVNIIEKAAANPNLPFDIADSLFKWYSWYGMLLFKNPITYELDKVDRYKRDIDIATKVVTIIQKWWRDVSIYNPRRRLANAKLRNDFDGLRHHTITEYGLYL